MPINIYKDPMQKAYLFGTAVLYSEEPIPQTDVPPYWTRYELSGTAQYPDKPYALMDQAPHNYVASVLSPLTLKKGAAKSRLVKDKLQLTPERLSLTQFCAEYGIPCPQIPLRHRMRPASPDEAGLFYALPPEQDEELGAIGHLRMDFGHRGQEFWHTWWPRGPEELNSPEFRDELDKVVNDLRKGILKDLPAMRRHCQGNAGAIDGGACCQNYGFVLETQRYIYRLRCNPAEGDYQAYLSCFVNQTQQMGLTEKGRQMLQDATDPDKPHEYLWYVIENINDSKHRVDHELPLEGAIQLYAELDSQDKRLGVTKDGITSVDLVIQHDGREWFPEDRLKLDSFAHDQVVADAAAKIQQALETQTQGMTMGGMA